MENRTKTRSYLVVVNPIARGGQAERASLRLFEALKSERVSHEIVYTEKPGHAERIVSERAKDFDVIVSAAGDGTTNEIINAIMNTGKKNLMLALFPLGTGDDLARNVGYRRNNGKLALEAILGDSSRLIDLIKYNNRYAAVSFGIGIDSEIAEGAYKWKVFRAPAYIYAGFKKFMLEGHKSYHVHFEYEGEIFDDQVLLSVICNAPRIARHIKINPQARMNDGILNMTIGKEMPNFLGVILFFLASIGGKHEYSHYVTLHELKAMRIEFQEFTYAQADGEVIEFEAGDVVSISVEPKALEILVPEESLHNRKLPFV